MALPPSVVGVSLVVMLATCFATVTSASVSSSAVVKHLARGTGDSTPAARSRRCPWTTPSEQASLTPSELAAQVVAHMNLAEKLSMVSLAVSGGYQNATARISALCIPALTLQDGPDGLANNTKGVTQLPSSIGIAASFDPSLAYDYGVVEGAEARTKGIDVVQGPNLNLDRVPSAGRNFEGYGEDPYLVSKFGVADIEGIQSKGVMANAKHFTAYNQETDRRHLDEIISKRALEELYLPAFRAAVSQGHVASVMCAYGEINHVNPCQSKSLFSALTSWGFQGFVRSDLWSVTDPVVAFRNGLDAIKPAMAGALRAALVHHALSIGRLDGAVASIVSEMFAYKLIGHAHGGNDGANATTPAHAAFADRAAEASMVLLKNRGQVLPLSRHARSVAVIGADAASQADTAGWGSSHVIAPFLITPLASLRRTLGPSAAVSYSPGGETNHGLPGIPAHVILAQATHRGLSTVASIARVIPPAERTHLMTTTIIARFPASATYSVSLGDASATWLFANAHLLLSSPGPHAPMTWLTSVSVQAHVPLVLTVIWDDRTASAPRIGWQDESPAIAQAVQAARAAKTALVFVGDPSGEAADRPSLALPGDANALISAVAAVNAHTVVVINSGGAVLMPWLDKVAAVLEAWYPGEEDGAATAAVLTGEVDPGGRLPVTFPTSPRQGLGASDTSFPGVNGVVHYSEGLDIGYRYDQAHHLRPLFAFGFGLSYTHFALANFALSRTSGGYDVVVQVTNTGKRPGNEVVQAYLHFPVAAGEPPLQLKAFQSVSLRPGETRVVSLFVSDQSFLSYPNGSWVTVPGTYTIQVGESSADLAFAAPIAQPAPSVPTVPTSSTPVQSIPSASSTTTTILAATGLRNARPAPARKKVP